jgi:hypothetical protein
MSLSENHDRAARAAARLAPAPVSLMLRQGQGGNNRLYRVTTGDGRHYALKWYARPPGDTRDRLGTEWAALDFLGRHGLEQVPRAIAADAADGFALYEWIEGTAVGEPDTKDIEAALAFAHRLHDLRKMDGADQLPLASEACLTLAELLAQIERRLSRLTEVAAEHPDLSRFLNEDFSPRHHRLVDRAGTAGKVTTAPLPKEHRTLSPSDFGFHNALRRPDGSLVFLDFEYFGWDDPVKLVADFQQHPGMTLPISLARRFAQGAGALYADPGYAERLAATAPLFALRWCLILLNEFLPERWHNRHFAGHGDDRRRAMRSQLAKARSHLRQHATDEAP